jgi:hypothetical protein
MGLATIWATFSHTHLVTLLSSYICFTDGKFCAFPISEGHVFIQKAEIQQGFGCGEKSVL